MLSDAQRENTKIILKELVELWDSRSSLYGNALFCSAVARGQDGKWRNATSFLLPMHKEESRSIGVQADYGNFKLIECSMTLEQAKAVLSEIVERDCLRLPGLPEITIQVSMYPNSSKYFHHSGTRRFPLLFPYYEFNFSIEQEYKGDSSREALHRVDLPLLPSGSAAIEHYFSARLGDDSSCSGVLVALVPDYRGRIKEIRLGTNSVGVEVVCMAGSSESDLIGKLYSKSYAGIVDCIDLTFNSGKAVTKISDFPHDLLVALLSRDGGDLIDRRQFLAGSRYVTPDVLIENPEQDIEQTIEKGESDTVEFKREIPQKREMIAIGAVALANRRGGQILIGVGDNGEIVGCRLEKPKDTITQILRGHCDPPIEAFVEQVNIRDLPVIVVTVPAGKDKPYAVKDKGVFIRSGATNRIATRYELDEMYGSKQNLFGQ
jgi:hypothetical protein